MKSSPENNAFTERLAQGRKPIDFTKRSVKLRIFGLLAALMVVLAVADWARKPNSWQWLWDFDPARWDGEKFDNRLAPKPMLTHGDPAGTFVSSPGSESPAKPADPAAPVAGQLDPVERTWEQGWKDVFNRLDEDQKTLLYELLHAGAHHQALPEGKTEASATLLEDATTLWEDYAAVAFQSVATLPAADQSTWVDVLRVVNMRWAGDVRPALQAVIDARTPTEHEEKMLAGFQKTLDDLMLARIEDDTVFLRPAEREIWLRLEGRAQDATDAELRKKSVGHVGYLQLHKQPDEYRGKVVTFRGVVKHAYRVPASASYLGVKEHFVYWVMPAVGPPSPIVVYALGVPAGFPQIEDQGNDQLQRLHEEVVVNGFFLKRGAYLAKDGTYTAPLVIANTPEWVPQALSLDDASRFSIGPAWLLPTVGASALVGVFIFIGVYWRIRRSEAVARAQVTAAREPTPDALARLEVTPSPTEMLRQMEQAAQHEETTP